MYGRWAENVSRRRTIALDRSALLLLLRRIAKEGWVSVSVSVSVSRGPLVQPCFMHLLLDGDLRLAFASSTSHLVCFGDCMGGFGE